MPFMDSEALYRGCVKNNRDAWTYAYNYAIAVLKKKNTAPEDIQDIAQMVMEYYIKGGLARINEPGLFKYLLARKTILTRVSYYLRAYRSREESWECVIFGENGLESFPRQGCDTCENTLEHDLSAHMVAAMARDLLNGLDDHCSRILKAYYKSKATGTRIKEIAPHFNMMPNTFTKNVGRCQEKLLQNPGFNVLLKIYVTDLQLEN